MNDDFTKDDDQEIDFDPKKAKDLEDDPLLADEPLLEDDLLDEEDEEEYAFDGDSDDDDIF